MSKFDGTILIHGPRYTPEEFEMLLHRTPDPDGQAFLLSQFEKAIGTPYHNLLPHMLESLPNRYSDPFPRVMFLCGRGSGKTATMLQLLEAIAIEGRDEGLAELGYAFHPKVSVGILGVTYSMVDTTIISGENGLLERLDQLGVIRSSDRGKGLIQLTKESGGAMISWGGSDNGERGRGSNLGLYICDELAAQRSWEAHRNHLDGLRVTNPNTGLGPLCLIGTTPRLRPEMRALVDDPATKVVRATALGNPFVSKAWKDDLQRRYPVGSVLYRLEWLGQEVYEVPGALFQDEWFLDGEPERADRTIVAVDPSMRAGRDMAGVLVLSIDRETGIVSVEDDFSTEEGPEVMLANIRRAVQLHEADLILVEGNSVRELLKQVFKSNDPGAPVKYIDATASKASRAEVAAIHAEKGLLRIPDNPKMRPLRNELISWVPGESRYSPGRLDALAHGVRHLVDGKLAYGKMSAWTPTKRSTPTPPPARKGKLSLWVPGQASRAKAVA